MENQNFPDVCQAHSGVKSDIDNLKKSDKSQWEHITTLEEKVGKLVPVWITIILMAMSALTGSALTFAGMILKFAGN
jgi:hypothetical protein